MTVVRRGTREIQESKKGNREVRLWGRKEEQIGSHTEGIQRSKWKSYCSRGAARFFESNEVSMCSRLKIKTDELRTEGQRRTWNEMRHPA